MPVLARDFSERRAQMHLTQVEVAEMSGLSVRLVREIEAGRANPGLRQLESLAAALNLTLTLQARRP